WVYSFSELDQAESAVEGKWEQVRALLGGKGANLAEMTRIGIPVPHGFTITTKACNAYLNEGEKFPEGMWEQILDALAHLEQATGKKFGDQENPLLVSARSGGKFSMPGMMDTVLNIGLNDNSANGLARLTNDQRFTYDAYRRLVHMFGSVVLEIDDDCFENALDAHKRGKSIELDTELDAEDWQAVIEEYKNVLLNEKAIEFPQDPIKQLRMSIESVFKSWNGKRAVDYRNATGIAHDMGTAVNIVTMVFGNMEVNSGTGVAFTRNPATGERLIYGDYLLNAQGEDVVAGIRNPSPIGKLEKDLPNAYAQFSQICQKLEKHYRDIQDVEFTIEQGTLWMLQTRDGKRTAQAAVKIAVDMVNEGLINREEAVNRVSPDQVDTLLHPQFELEAERQATMEGRCFTRGVNASPGAAVGQVYFDADKSVRMVKEQGLDIIMVRPFTKPEDVHGMLAAKGVLTSEGGATSHAAVVARQFGLPCVVGAASVSIDLEKACMSADGVQVDEGDWLSVNGTTGEVFLGQIPTVAPKLTEQKDLLTLLDWADEICAEENIRQTADGLQTSGLQVWANADYPADALRARRYGAKGIGLCRTEHMFFEQERLPIVQQMILADTTLKRQEALDKLLPFQYSDFEGLFRAMDGYPVIIRLIDPPLHEFLPDHDSILEEVVTLRISGDKKKLKEKEALLWTVRSLHETNPMLGMRGVRLGVMMPEIVEMQVRAIFEAAADVALEGIRVFPEVMIPLTGHVNELKFIQPRLERIAKDVMETKDVFFDYKFGTMIEIPRAALTAAEIAEVAEFFSFGTNDLTQMTYGYSRDDAEGNFLLKYVEDGILPGNPFQSIDQAGVGRLMKLCIDEGRLTRPELEIGICGEHGGDPASIDFCHVAGLNYVSCSPFRVPIARLAAAHAALKYKS
ncbi:MAG: pyruvate, phosphate dikinase, partial [Chloroflexota bacterium]